MHDEHPGEDRAAARSARTLDRLNVLQLDSDLAVSYTHLRVRRLLRSLSVRVRHPIMQVRARVEANLSALVGAPSGDVYRLSSFRTGDK